MKKVLVTGGTGFTGSHLVKRLLAEGQHVRVVDSAPGIFFDELNNAGAEIQIGSVTDRQLIDDATRGCDVVYHVAAAFRELNVSDRHYEEVNVGGTRNVAEAALRHGVQRLVYCSTQGVHGHINSPPGDETSPVAPEDYYQQTKYEGEAAIAEYVQQGLNAVTLRPTAIYGPGDPARFLILFKMVNRGRFLMFGSGKTFYHPVFIDNLVDAFLLASNPDNGTPGEAYIIGDDKYWPLNELVEHVAASLDKPVKIRHCPFSPLYAAACVCEFACKPWRVAPPLFRRRVNWFRQDRAFSIEKARRQLGYSPSVSLCEGLARTAQWYRVHNYIG